MVCFNLVVRDVTQVVKETPEYGVGVKTLAHVEPGSNIIVLDYLKVPVGLRRSGIGSQVLDELKTVALGHNVPLQVLPSPDFGTPMPALAAFYKNNGFRYQDGYYWFNQ